MNEFVNNTSRQIDRQKSNRKKELSPVYVRSVRWKERKENRSFQGTDMQALQYHIHID